MILDGFCTTTQGIWKFIGEIVSIFKIIIPVILVIIGIVAFGKAVISDDDKAIKKALTDMIKKIIVAVIIFFIPSIVKGIFNLIDGYRGSDYTKCIDCVAKPSSCQSDIAGEDLNLG